MQQLKSQQELRGGGVRNFFIVRDVLLRSHDEALTQASQHSHGTLLAAHWTAVGALALAD